MKLQVAVVEIIETRVAAHESGLGDRSHDEDRRGRAVIRPLRRVFLDPAAELAEREQGDAVSLPGGGQVVVKGGDRIGELVQECRMRSELVGMGVKAVERGVEDTRAEVRLDNLRDQLETSGQAEIGVLRSALLLLATSCSSRLLDS